MSTLSGPELQDLLHAHLPPIDLHDEIIEALGDNAIRMRLPFKPAYLGADIWRHTGNVVFSGPLTMGFAETAMYACIHACLGRDLSAVAANLTITFIRPVKAADLIAEARLIRAANRHAYVEAYLYNDGERESLAHVTATYAIAGR